MVRLFFQSYCAYKLTETDREPIFGIAFSSLLGTFLEPTQDVLGHWHGRVADAEADDRLRVRVLLQVRVAPTACYGTPVITIIVVINNHFW